MQIAIALGGAGAGEDLISQAGAGEDEGLGRGDWKTQRVITVD